ncbi:MAG: hypothetical protein HDR04_09160 [Lachnospiraceae bacterium]|nr:hypothetical protein [Lachnospiraceae bacterium]
MWYSCLSKRLPEDVEIDGRKYGIRFGYRTMIAIEILMYSHVSDENKMLQSLNLFYGNDIPENIDEAINKLLWFHSCGEENGQEKEGENKPKRQQKRAYDFKQDATMIYAAFIQQYGINLHSISSNELHWWEFSALFGNLSDDTKMAKVMYWRTCDLSGMSKAEQRYIRKMRNIFAIKEDVSMDTQAKLIQRNADMVGYIRRRYRECAIE